MGLVPVPRRRRLPAEPSPVVGWEKATARDTQKPFESEWIHVFTVPDGEYVYPFALEGLLRVARRRLLPADHRTGLGWETAPARDRHQPHETQRLHPSPVTAGQGTPWHR